MLIPDGPLTPDDIAHFRRFGYVKVPRCFDTGPGSLADRWVRRHWERMGYDPHDPDSWAESKVHLPVEESAPADEVAPKAEAAMAQLLGGRGRFHPPTWGDAFIANYQHGADAPWAPPSPESKGWHKDGDFFVHFLDSPEQALLVIVLWSDVVERGGPTSIAADSVPVVARSLAEHPEGLWPCCTEGPEADEARAAGEPVERMRIRDWINRCETFHEAVGEAGDVFLLHPFALHRASQNVRRVARLITNPPVALKQPFCYDREDGAYSVVEQCVLDALGVDRFAFGPTTARRRLVPPRIREQRELQTQIDARAGVRS